MYVPIFWIFWIWTIFRLDSDTVKLYKLGVYGKVLILVQILLYNLQFIYLFIFFVVITKKDKCIESQCGIESGIIGEKTRKPVPWKDYQRKHNPKIKTWKDAIFFLNLRSTFALIAPDLVAKITPNGLNLVDRPEAHCFWFGLRTHQHDRWSNLLRFSLVRTSCVSSAPFPINIVNVTGKKISSTKIVNKTVSFWLMPT